MFFAVRPSPATIAGFLAASPRLPLTYAPIGLARAASGWGDLDEVVATIGRGAADYERARAALCAWQQFALAWVEIFPRDAPTDAGSVVAVLMRHLGFWSLNGARVVYAVGDRHDGRVFGYAYGTLTNHAEAGEELFEVALSADTGDVTYRIRARSWPHAALARIGYPIVRALQAQFRRDSIAAMRRVVAKR
jgi:uncharacterized protein (UPF0548 family)